VHNEDSKVEIGQKVWIEEGKPVSKRKKFYLVKGN
jgi:ribosomal protein S17